MFDQNFEINTLFDVLICIVQFILLFSAQNHLLIQSHQKVFSQSQEQKIYPSVRVIQSS